MTVSAARLSRSSCFVAPRTGALVVATAAALTSVAGMVGADSDWAAALGQTIVRHPAIHGGVPFATAPSAGWPNVPVLSELLFGGLDSALGGRGLVLAQIAAVALASGVLRRAMLVRGASEGGAAVALLLVAAGALPDLVIVRLQVFSLALFPILLYVLHSAPGRCWRRLWMLPPLFLLWSNLHGGVLIGLLVLAAYLFADRLRAEGRRSALLLGACGLAAFATPATYRTPFYYLGVAGSESAREGYGLWQPLSPSNPLHVALIVCAIILIALALHAGLRRWEALALILLAASTVHTARTGVWLVMLTAVPAARALQIQRGFGNLGRTALGTVLVLLLAYGVVRGPLHSGASQEVVESAVTLSNGTPVLAEGILAEQVALAGGKLWIANPLDAFARQDQRLYLAWVKGAPSGAGALDHAPRVVLVLRGSKAAQRMGSEWGWRAVRSDDHSIIYLRAGAS